MKLGDLSFACGKSTNGELQTRIPEDPSDKVATNPRGWPWVARDKDMAWVAKDLILSTSIRV